MHKIEIGNIIKYYPERIDEMSQDQFIYFSEKVLQYYRKIISYDDLCLSLVYRFLGIKRKTHFPTSRNAEKILFNLGQLMKLNDSFFKDKIIEGKKFKLIRCDFVKNLIPKIKVGRKYYHGPDIALSNTCFGEYITALSNYMDFSKSHEEKDLDLLVASLYRPLDRSKFRKNDGRIDFDEQELIYYATKVKDVALSVKYGIYLWFSSCQKFIVTNKELEISGGIKVDLSVLFKSDKSSVKGIGMPGAVYSLAESQVFGNTQETLKQNTYKIFLRMYQTYQQAKQLKKNVVN